MNVINVPSCLPETLLKRVQIKPREKAFQIIVFINQSDQEVDSFLLLVAFSSEFVTSERQRYSAQSHRVLFAFADPCVLDCCFQYPNNSSKQFSLVFPLCSVNEKSSSHQIPLTIFQMYLCKMIHAHIFFIHQILVKIQGLSQSHRFGTFRICTIRANQSTSVITIADGMAVDDPGDQWDNSRDKTGHTETKSTRRPRSKNQIHIYRQYNSREKNSCGRIYQYIDRRRTGNDKGNESEPSQESGEEAKSSDAMMMIMMMMMMMMMMMIENDE